MRLLQHPDDAVTHFGLPPVVDHYQEVEIARSWLESAQRRRPVQIHPHQCRTNDTDQAFPQRFTEIRNRAIRHTRKHPTSPPAPTNKYGARTSIWPNHAYRHVRARYPLARSADDSALLVPDRSGVGKLSTGAGVCRSVRVEPLVATALRLWL